RLRFEASERIAQEARAARAPRAPWYAGDGLTILGESMDGPLSGLCACGDSLVSSDVRTVVRFEPASVVPELGIEASEHFVLVAAGARAWFATMNHGDVFVIEDSGPRRVAAGQGVPVELVAHGDRVAWWNRDTPGGRTLVIANASGIERTLGPMSALGWGL